MNGEAKLIAIYFPQLHEIPENNEWWGKGFTDWVNVKAAKQQYDGHYQPRVPLNSNYYDQSLLETLHWQINLAKEHGVHGFCHYHYWFDGKQLLEKPTNLFLENKDLQMPFCLSWANETWSKRWDGRNHHILIKQSHPPSKERWKLHFDYLIKAWTDDRAIKVDGKPVFIIYRPWRIPKINHMLNYWRELAIKNGLPGLYFIAQKQYEFPDRSCLNEFDAVFEFQPFEAQYRPPESVNHHLPQNDLHQNDLHQNDLPQKSHFKLMRAMPEYVQKSYYQTRVLSGYAQNILRSSYKQARILPEFMQDILRSSKSLVLKTLSKEQLSYYDYEKVWSNIVKVRNLDEMTTYPGAFVDWDNTARYKDRATIYEGANPERFEYWLGELIKSMPSRDLPEPYIFLNAWNEWAEGAYLEPDQKYEYKYLEATKRVLTKNEDS